MKVQRCGSSIPAICTHYTRIRPQKRLLQAHVWTPSHATSAKVIDFASPPIVRGGLVKREGVLFWVSPRQP